MKTTYRFMTIIFLVVSMLGIMLSVPKPDHAQASPTVEVVVDDGDNGFYATAGWISASGWTDCQGYGGDAKWTYSRVPPNTNDIDYVTWAPNIPQRGTYEVFVHIPRFYNALADTQNALYTIYHNGGVTTVKISQEGMWCQWISLGRYEFSVGMEIAVRLGDYTNGENPQRGVITDAVKFVLAQETPPTDPIIIDDGDSGFTSSQGWTIATSGWTRNCTGENGDARWTYSRRLGHTDDVDWSRWTPNLPISGSYDIYVLAPGIDNGLSDTENSRYHIQNARGEDVVTISQRDNWCTWIPLGKFYFNAGTSGWVQLGDYTGGESPQTSVVVDAVKWVYADDTIPPTFTPTPTPTATLPPSQDIVGAAQADIGMPYWSNYGRGASRQSGPFGPWHYEAGVCTDVVIDSYVTGAGQNWAWTQFWRNSQVMRKYFQDHQLYLTNDQAWRLGDIFFVGFPNEARHVGIVTAVNAQGQPTRFVHASKPGTTASENNWSWSWCCGYTVLGHGRLSTSANLNMAVPASEFYELSVFLKTDSHTKAQLYLYDEKGNFVSRLFDMGYPASSNSDYDPYLANGSYDNDSIHQWIVLTDFSPGSYRVELLGEADTNYDLNIAVLKNGQTYIDQNYNGSLQANDFLTVPLVIDANYKMVNAPETTSLSSSPRMVVPEKITLSGSSTSFTIKEITGIAGFQNVIVQATDFTLPTVEQLPSNMVQISPATFTLGPNSQQKVLLTLDPKYLHLGEIYLGSLQIIASDGTVRKIPMTIEVTAFTTYLPLVSR